jgi:hypothetical protein
MSTDRPIGPLAIRPRPAPSRPGYEWVAAWAAYDAAGRIVIARRTRDDVISALAA